MAATSPLIGQEDPSIFARMGIADTSGKKPDAASDAAPSSVVDRVKAALDKERKEGDASPDADSSAQKPPTKDGMPGWPGFRSYDPPPKREDTPPIEAWGSLAMLAAALGGALSRNHATTALNAAGEAMKGIHARDEEKYKDAMANWKVATDNQQRAQTYEIETYKAIMSQNKTSFDEFMKLSRERQQEIATQLHAQTVAQGNERIANLLEHQQNEDAIKQMQALQKATNDLQKERDKIDGMNTATSEFTRLRAADPTLKFEDFAWKYHPELAEKYKLKTSEEQAAEKAAAAAADTRNAWTRNAPTWAGGQPAPQPPPQGTSAASAVPDIMLGGKHLRYNGSGDTRDPKNYTPVQ